MSRQITPTELARIIAGLLVTPERVGELIEARPFANFFTAAAELVANYCGGEVRNDASSIEDDDGKALWFVGIHANPDLPDPIRNIWSLADPEGVDLDEGTAYSEDALPDAIAAKAERDLLPAALALLPSSPQLCIEAVWVLSTRHLSDDECEALSATTPGGGVLVSARSDFGALIHVEGSADVQANLWPNLAPLLAQAAAYGVPYLRFDADGPVSPHLPMIARAD